MSQMRDLPPIAGAIIWAREIERQLSTYMKRVEDVLGKDWVLYAEGQKLQTESSSFRRKLDTRQLYEGWLHDINRRDMGINGRLFEIVRLRGGGFQLGVNFDAQIITLFKEVRNLLWLNYQVPHAISNMAKDAKRVYPHAVSLMETVRTYSQTLDLIEKNPAIEILVAEFRNEAQRMISRGTSLSDWRASRFLPLSVHPFYGCTASQCLAQLILFVYQGCLSAGTSSSMHSIPIDTCPRLVSKVGRIEISLTFGSLQPSCRSFRCVKLCMHTSLLSKFSAYCLQLRDKLTTF